ncbi:MAG: S8 family serine peptidase, partial [Candidatus Omnitrophica bacterium]|nr:S8 family serine peptidase [Candidatus Omnitrophota bacterium]
MKFFKAVVSLFFLSLLIFSSFAFAEDQPLSYEQYLNDLHAQGKERVIVKFKGALDPALIEQYDGTIIHTLSIINAIVCEIPQTNVEFLQSEGAVENVSIDGIIKADTNVLELNRIEYANILRVKKEYLAKIRMERVASIKKSTQEYLEAIRNCLAKRKEIMNLYKQYLKKLKKANKMERPIYLQQLAECKVMLKECNTLRKQALEHYKESINLAKETYKLSAASWFIRASEIIASESTGATPEWENLEAGLNAQAVWDRYGLDGTGIKIAFLDTGINYNLPDLGGGIGSGYKCLAGRNFFITDPLDPLYYDPMPFIHPTDWTESEWHGTSVASNSVGSGVSQIIGPAKNASYYSLRILSGPNAIGPTSNAIAAIEWCLDPDGNPLTNDRPDIINMSFGAYAAGPDKTDLETACNAAYNAGIILVAASGNNGYEYSTWPASFINVISVGGHAKNQTLMDRWIGGIHYISNGGVDFVAPGEYIRTLIPEGDSSHYGTGTSGAVASVSGMLALTLQYAHDNDMQPNHGYLWELLKHSAQHLVGPTPPDPYPYDPVYQGSGKVWAADTAPTPPDLDDGSIDCMAAKWPLSYNIVYDNYLYLEEDLYPAYYIGTFMYYDVALTNNTNTSGNYLSDIENLKVTTTQAYYQHEGEAILPGSPICAFSPVSSLTAGSLEILPDTYYLPW